MLRDIYRNGDACCRRLDGASSGFFRCIRCIPATLEVAPLIRLYCQDFALLGICGRGGRAGYLATSEFADRARRDVRQRRDKTASDRGAQGSVCDIRPDRARGDRESSRYDAFAGEAHSEGLFLLSMVGQGASADDIAAAMMVYGRSGRWAVARLVRLGRICRSKTEHFGSAAADRMLPPRCCALDIAAAKVSDDDVWTYCCVRRRRSSLISKRLKIWAERLALHGRVARSPPPRRDRLAARGI